VVLSGWAGATLGPANHRRGTATQPAGTPCPTLYGDIQIELGQLGAEAVALGAATLPVRSILSAGADRWCRAF